MWCEFAGVAAVGRGAFNVRYLRPTCNTCIRELHNNRIVPRSASVPGGV